jgi:hypothetical protein
MHVEGTTGSTIDHPLRLGHYPAYNLIQPFSRIQHRLSEYAPSSGSLPSAFNEQPAKERDDKDALWPDVLRGAP